jgi:hypothetical protein
VNSIDSYGDWESWAQANGYEEDFHDEDENSEKRHTRHYGYARHIESNTYALVTWISTYDNGCEMFDILKKGLVRSEQQVTKTVVTYA